MSLSKVATICQGASRPRWCDLALDETDCIWANFVPGVLVLPSTPKNRKQQAVSFEMSSSSSSDDEMTSKSGSLVLREQFRQLAIQAETEVDSDTELGSTPVAPAAPAKAIATYEQREIQLDDASDSLLLDESSISSVVDALKARGGSATMDLGKGVFSASTTSIFESSDGDHLWVGSFTPSQTKANRKIQSRKLCFSFAKGMTCCAHFATGKCNRGEDKCNFAHVAFPAAVAQLMA